MPSTNHILAEATPEVRAAIAERDAKIEALIHSHNRLREQNNELRANLTTLRRQMERMLNSRSGAQTTAESQLSFLDIPPSVPEKPGLGAAFEHLSEAPDGEVPEDPIKKRNQPKRRAQRIDMGALPREVVRYELPESERICPKTGVRLVPIGEKVFEEIDYTPGKLSILEHRQVQYGPSLEVAAERQIDVVTADLPARPLEGCAASAGLLAQIVIQKTAYHLPLYRQEELFQQAGLWIPRQTLCDWVMKVAFELQPIVNEMMRQISAGPVLQLDDTRLRCRGPNGTGYFQAYLWAFVNPQVDAVVFRFSSGRSTEALRPHLEGVGAGIFVGDGYKGNLSAAREAGLDVIHAGCWAHTLRGFRDAKKEAHRMSGLFQADISELYDVERQADERGLDSKERLDLRRERSRPILARILRRTRGWNELFHANGKMGDAIKYLLNGRKSLTVFLSNGVVPIDNNACERVIRPVAVGRKNWLFAGSERGGVSAANLYSVIESCRLARVDMWEYLRDVLLRVGTHPAKDIADLVPARWAQLRAAAQAT